MWRDCGPRCSRQGSGLMQDWKKRGGLVRGARYTAEFEDVEIHVMDSLALSVSTVLRQRRDSAPQDPLAEIAGMHTGHTQTPEDPALARLLPDFELPEHQQFPGEQELMRSMNEYDIITSKYDNIMVLLELCQVGPVWTVDETQALAIIGALNDIRSRWHKPLNRPASPSGQIPRRCRHIPAWPNSRPTGNSEWETCAWNTACRV